MSLPSTALQSPSSIIGRSDQTQLTATGVRGDVGSMSVDELLTGCNYAVVPHVKANILCVLVDVSFKRMDWSRLRAKVVHSYGPLSGKLGYVKIGIKRDCVPIHTAR